MTETAARVEAVRRFNRFYTRRIGVLLEGLLDSPYSLTESRILYELAQTPGTTASSLGRDLGLDAGYVSRLLGRLEHSGVLSKKRSETDGRQSLLQLTEAGRQAFDELDTRSRREIGAMLAPLSDGEQTRLVDAMHAVESLLGSDHPPTVTLRGHRPGDMGWIVHRHGALYAREYGWDASFEAMVAEIAAQFIRDFDASKEGCWIAERDTAYLGSVCLVRQSASVAKLRLLIVEPAARGLGIGRRLVETCLDFARSVGYRRITLWTNANLVAAVKLYQSFGFTLVHEEPHHSFGHDLIGQNWELELD